MKLLPMLADAPHDFLKILAKAGNLRATADALGCSLEVVRRRMAGVKNEEIRHAHQTRGGRA